ncbi:MAG: tRNA-dihydrouridine synthase [Sedimentisphaerales bacterium]|nr:tRNA-dihydrouridine synthase [Sedimentisphaerales bacterium]
MRPPKGGTPNNHKNMRNPLSLKLGALTLDVPFFQASLSGYSDYAMRRLARCFGCPFALADMMLAKSAAHPGVLDMPCFRPGEDEHPVGAQILGKTPATMARAAAALAAVGYDLIDLNFACPAPKVLRKGRGGALLDDPDTVIDILKAVRDAVTCPVLMKLRLGANRKPECLDRFWQIVTRAVEQNVDALVIHGRTLSEKYRGKADWDILAEVKWRFPHATIVGSGDIFDPSATVELLKRTGLDGFVVARGAVGNPWIFRELRCVWEGRPVPPPPDLAEQRAVMLDHLDWTLQGYPELLGVGHFRKFAVGYARHHPKRKQVLLTLLKAKTRAEVEAAIDAWYK